MKDKFAAVFSHCGEGGWEGGGIVDDNQIVGVQKLQQIAESSVDHGIAATVAHQQPYIIAGETSCLWRLTRLERRRQLKVHG
jgi:hypothetical protein